MDNDSKQRWTFKDNAELIIKNSDLHKTILSRLQKAKEGLSEKQKIKINDFEVEFNKIKKDKCNPRDKYDKYQSLLSRIDIISQSEKKKKKKLQFKALEKVNKKLLKKYKKTRKELNILKHKFFQNIIGSTELARKVTVENIHENVDLLESPERMKNLESNINNISTYEDDNKNDGWLESPVRIKKLERDINNIISSIETDIITFGFGNQGDKYENLEKKKAIEKDKNLQEAAGRNENISESQNIETDKSTNKNTGVAAKSKSEESQEESLANVPSKSVDKQMKEKENNNKIPVDYLYPNRFGKEATKMGEYEESMDTNPVLNRDRSKVNETTNIDGQCEETSVSNYSVFNVEEEQEEEEQTKKKKVPTATLR